ncbi:energy transducer TonB [uncultured Draconibacterium sp.]|uniref:energy transducer TonB n=1 Tax=uncultured Draconibacterium sp. TaxID=1573823 RepID=UPI002AA6C01B|nr:energy transducer TonB [uncultured Draconibacterium sp.]
MKTIKILFVCMLAAIFAHAQETVPPYMMHDVEVTPPKFTAVKYTQPENANSLKAYISQNFEYNPEFGKTVEGTEVVKFVINTDGRVSDVEVVNSVSSTVDRLITNIIEETDYMWVPGKNNGVPVAMEKEIAVKIKLGMTEKSAERRDFTEIARNYFTKGSEKLFFDRKAKKAIKQFELAIRYRPYDQAALYMLALCEMDQGNENAAQAYVDRFKELGGDLNLMDASLTEHIKSIEAHEDLAKLFAIK